MKRKERDNMTRMCSRCIYNDEHIPNIKFDENGECNYCKEYDLLDKLYPIDEKKFDELVKRIKRHPGKYYDCVVGVSGGCDSSYILAKLVDAGVKPLAVNYDNHWGTKIAVDNLYKITDGLNVDLLKITVDKKEYDDIVRSFFLAGVPDIEIPADMGLITALLHATSRAKCKFLVDAHNFRTEGSAPLGFIYMDAKYIDSVHKQYGNISINTYQNLWMKDWLMLMIVNRIKRVRPLPHLNYHKPDAIEELEDRFGWEWYGGHHFENKLTFFFHNYFNPRRFNRDQRYLDYSASIRSGEITRNEALKLIKKPLPQNNDIVEEVKTRLKFSDDDFERLMTMSKRTHHDFETYHPLFKRYRWFFWLMSRFDLVPKTFYLKYTK